MKVIQVPFCFHPNPVGGTEVYVESLTRNLQKLGIGILVGAPGEREAEYVHEGIAVRRFTVGPVTNLRDLYGEGDLEASRAFGKILDEERPDLVHLHAFTRGVSLRLVREAKSRGVPVIFTYHTPTVSCQRGTLMRWGTEVCDGVLRLHTCSRCTLHGLGAGKGPSYLLGTLPTAVGRLLGAAGLSGGIWTGLRITELVNLKHQSFRALMAEVDHVVATAEWVKNLLIRNNVPPEKITISRQGLYQNGFDSSIPKPEIRDSRSELKVAFVGRMHPTKGLDILIQAIRLLPRLKMTLDIYGLIQGEEDRLYQQKISSLANGDRRIHFYDTVSNPKMVSLLQNVDVLAVPSQGLETGPMVVLEAFSAGIPVIGSHLGGVAELVEHEVNGLLVKPNSVEEWSQMLRRVVEDQNLLMKLRSNIRSLRTMEIVAREMASLYYSLLQEKAKRQKFVISAMKSIQTI